ncbi:hypothetical protein VP01_130g12 [Puccinia sorghi]|uniref:Uncharacterized protein n=1 Tax=Puccinia sorghi TaxID=27349 RepID=A0A0L6VN60_9BASI|nr:hypothetical protein VP01_130g12 [Puccinia sorghi]
MAISILEIVPHAAGVEGLFSLMNAMKTKARNRLSPNTSKMMAHIKLHLLQGDPLLEYEYMKAYDSFLTPAELEAVEDGIFNEEQNNIVTSRQDAFIETLFDFDLWEQSPPEPDS